MCKGQQKRKLNSPSVSEFTRVQKYIFEIFIMWQFFIFPCGSWRSSNMRTAGCIEDDPAQSHLKLHLNWNIKFLLFSLEPLQYRFSSLHHCCSKMFVNRFLFWQRSTHFCAICVFNYINISIFNIVHDPFFILIFQLFLYLNLPAF